MAQPRESSPARPAHTAPPAVQSRIHYLTFSLFIAALWLLNRDKSLLYHAVQMGVLMSVLTGLQIVLLRRAGEAAPYARLIVAKVVLVGLAVGGEALLSQETSLSNAIVAGGLVVLPTALGPTLDRLAANRAAGAAGREQTHRSSPGRGNGPKPTTPGEVRP